jgi:uncharacterized metal-binding protein
MLLPCHGATAEGIAAVAERLAERGVVEVVDDIEQLVAAARGGREVIALDACPSGCQARILDASGVASAMLTRLEDAGFVQRSAHNARRDARGLVALSTVHTGGDAHVERLEETGRERLRVLSESGIAPGSRLRDIVVNEAAGLVTFEIAGSTGVVSTTLAASVLVRVEGGVE